MLSEVYPNSDSASAALFGWVRENWNDEDSDPDDFVGQEMVDYFFEYNEDYAWYLQPINVPKTQNPEQDILLTPAMCRIVRESLGNFQFNFAQVILDDEEERDLGTGEQVLEMLIAQFE